MTGTTFGRQMAERYGWGEAEWGAVRLLAGRLHADLDGARGVSRRRAVLGRIRDELASAFGIDPADMAACFDARIPPKRAAEGTPMRKAQDVAFAFTLTEAGGYGIDPGPTVARLRLAAGMSQYTLADAAGISRNALMAIEAGRSAPSLETAKRLCEALGVSLAVFDGPAKA